MLEGWFGLPRIARASEDGTGAGEGGKGGDGDDKGGDDKGGSGDGAKAPGESFDFGKYRESINDATLKAYSERFKDFEEVLKTHQTQRQELSDRIRIPSDKSSPEEMQKFRKSFGVPELPAGYEIKLPDGLSMSDDDKAIIEAWRPIAHQHNVPAKAFNAMIAESLKLSKTLEEAFDKRLSTAQAETEAALKKEWSVDYDKNLALAKRAAIGLGGDEFWNYLDQAILEGGGKLASQPAMLRFLANIGRKSDESDLMLISSTAERSTAKQQLEELLAKHPVDSKEYKTAAVQTQVRELYEKIYGKGPIVGTDARVA